MSDKEFSIILLRKFSELQVGTDRQLNKIRETISEQKENFNKFWNHRRVPSRNSNSITEEYLKIIKGKHQERLNSGTWSSKGKKLWNQRPVISNYPVRITTI